MLTLPPQLNQDRESERPGVHTPNPPDPDSLNDSDPEEGMSPVAGRTRTRKAHLQAPLRQAVGPEGPVWVKVPFSVSDLKAWKEMAGIYWEDPDRVAKVMETIINNQDPDWKDLQVILNNLMTFEEKRIVLAKAREEAERTHPQAVQAGQLDRHFPENNPNWDPNNPPQRLMLTEYQRLVLYGIRNAIPKAKNWSKLYQVIQGKDENPLSFLERLLETAQKYTDLDPENERDQVSLVHIFMGQSSTDIKRKLQKLEGADARSLDKMLENAWKVFNNREKEEEEHKKKERTRETKLLAATIALETSKVKGQGCGGPRRGNPRPPRFQLEKDQCAFCKKKGHWENDCPQLRNGEREAMPLLTLDSD
ncbi:hypothetical protein GRJ2_003330600 [Grus japonensis]|uniref:CCHC-type domain-containing protein n=1 Tax=Grus japonensis TaxID=30415 RepID=A0ABC9YEZ9_GRUJA